LAPFLGRIAVCSIRCGLLLLMWRGLLVTSECCAKTAKLIDMPFGCGFGRARGNVADRRGQFLGSYLAMRRLVHGRYSQPYSLEAAAMRPLATSLLYHLVFT